MPRKDLELTIKRSDTFTVKVEATFIEIIEDYAKYKHLSLDEAIINLIKAGIAAEASADSYEAVEADYMEDNARQI